MLQSVATKAFKFRPVAAFRRSPKCVILSSGCGDMGISSPLPGARHYSYFKSKVEETPDKYTQYEKSFEEWKFVEKLIPPKYVPQAPQDPNVEYPSGWTPANPPKDSEYCVRRTENHMIPVYVKIEGKGMVRHTYIKKVEGNIWQLEKDIGQWLQDKYTLKTIATRTHEIHRQIIIKGDYVEDVREWMIANGF